MTPKLTIRSRRFSEHDLRAWRAGHYSLVKDCAGPLKRTLRKKASQRPGRRFFGEAYVAATVPHHEGWLRVVQVAHFGEVERPTEASGSLPEQVSPRANGAFSRTQRLSTPVRLEFVVRPPLGAGPSPGSGRSNGHCSARHGPPCVRRRRSTACGPSTTRGCVPRWRRPDARLHATLPQSWIQRENWEFETHRLRRIIPNSACRNPSAWRSGRW